MKRRFIEIDNVVNNDVAACGAQVANVLRELCLARVGCGKEKLCAGRQIVNDLDAIESLGVIPILGDYLEEAGAARHNTARVARDLMQIMSDQPKRDRAPGSQELAVRSRLDTSPRLAISTSAQFTPLVFPASQFTRNL